MIILTVSFDTQATCSQQVRALLKGGQVLHSTGILNTRWDDYSALHITKEVRLENIEWDYVADDTAGTLEITLWYPHLNSAQVNKRLQDICGVEEVETIEYLLYNRDSSMPLDSD